MPLWKGTPAIWLIKSKELKWANAPQFTETWKAYISAPCRFVIIPQAHTGLINGTHLIELYDLIVELTYHVLRTVKTLENIL